MKFLAPARQYFVAVRLMPNVPYQFVFWRVICVVNCNSKLNYTKAGAKMSAMNRYHINDKFTKLITKILKLFRFQFFQVVRRVYVTKEGPRNRFVAFHNWDN